MNYLVASSVRRFLVGEGLSLVVGLEPLGMRLRGVGTVLGFLLDGVAGGETADVALGRELDDLAGEGAAGWAFKYGSCRHSWTEGRSAGRVASIFRKSLTPKAMPSRVSDDTVLWASESTNLLCRTSLPTLPIESLEWNT